MKEVKHTPLPWVMHTFPDMDGYKIRGGGTAWLKGPRVLAIIKNQESAPAGESRANAALFFAAPDLLFLVKWMVAHPEECIGDHGNIERQAIEIIAKAEGRDQ